LSTVATTRAARAITACEEYTPYLSFVTGNRDVRIYENSEKGA